jgi:hypothetical protein
MKSLTLALAAAALTMAFIITPVTWAVALPEYTTEASYSSSVGTVTIETNAAIVGKLICTAGTGEYTTSNKKDSSYHLHFTGCVCKKTSALGGGTAAAESLGDNPGVILSLGTLQLVRLHTEDAGVWFLATPFDLTCLFSTELLFNIKGNLLGLIEPILKNTKTFKINIAQSGGKQAITEYETNGGTRVAQEGLKLELGNTGGFINSSIEAGRFVLTATSATEIIKTT